MLPERTQPAAESAAKANIARFGLIGPQTRTYQPADWEVVDYQLYDFAGTGIHFRGPDDEGLSQPGAQAAPGSIAILGAAQIFGRLCEAPIGALAEAQTGRRVYNFGYSGASPGFFLNCAPLLDFIGGCRAVVLQLTAATAFRTG
jgi:Domain of unknown function (DUF6473)